MKSVKKTFLNSLKSRFSDSYVSNYIANFSQYFQQHRFDNTKTATNYVLGLLKCAKSEANMERMEEEIPDSEYRAYQHFISNSNWDCEGLNKAVALECSQILSDQKLKNNKPTGYIVDESSHLKKGVKSVGVGRQYAGTIGKVDNCQVGVYSSLVNEKYASIINERLFLQESWTEDFERCKKAGIPKKFQKHKTKPQLALDMIKQDIKRGVKFDWIGGDGLYGHNSELCKGLDKLKQFFVLDVHKDEKVFMEKPSFIVPKKKSGSRRKPTKLRVDKESIRLDIIVNQIETEDWKLEEIRDTTKGKLKLFVYKTQIWTWDGQEKKARKRTLIITKTTAQKSKIKYSFSNGKPEQYSHREYAYFVAQRYWVERTFDNAKNELGMSDYQTRKWKSWHHHHSLVMLASLFIMRQQTESQEDVPLLSFRDARILVILQVFGTEEDVEIRLKQMEKRHQKRKYDIDRNYKKQAKNQEMLT